MQISKCVKRSQGLYKKNTHMFQNLYMWKTRGPWATLLTLTATNLSNTMIIPRFFFGGGGCYSKLHFNQNLSFRRYMAVLFARFRNLVILAWWFRIKLENVSKVINVFSITSAWRRMWFPLWTNLNPFHWRMLYVCKFVNWHWPDGFGEDKNVKSL